ncbi:unnamed protein product, partial [Orchesella dallaii]
AKTGRRRAKSTVLIASRSRECRFTQENLANIQENGIDACRTLHQPAALCFFPAEFADNFRYNYVIVTVYEPSAFPF